MGGYDIKQVASPEGFKKDPQLVYEFYNKRRKQLLSDEVAPNAAHKALAHLEEWSKGEFNLITQNVDDLHERSGSVNVYHIHGELLSARCMETNKAFGWESDLDQNSVNPRTGKAGTLRPDIVWFGEQLRYQMEVGSPVLPHLHFHRHFRNGLSSCWLRRGSSRRTALEQLK